ncbi:TPA: hypothetical protein RE968_003400 [Pseudomonas aeruginosa]|nr:hypothetical protein [Pseudomonas aeruginosa]
MLYLILCSLAMLVAVASLHHHMLKTMDYLHDSEMARPNPLIALIPMLATSAFCAPILVLFFGDLFVDAENGSPTNNGRVQIYFLLAGSLGLLVMGLLSARSAWTTGKLSFWATGRLAVLVLAGSVGSVSAYQHLTFFSSDQDGIANVGILRELADLNDMEQCASAVALVQFRNSGPFTYRCPTTVLFNRNSQQPFAPWPDYVEGSSQKLADTILSIKDAAERGYPVNKREK